MKLINLITVVFCVAMLSSISSSYAFRGRGVAFMAGSAAGKDSSHSSSKNSEYRTMISEQDEEIENLKQEIQDLQDQINQKNAAPISSDQSYRQEVD